MVLGQIINNTLNSIPGVGHAKGAFHHLTGNHDAGNEAFNAATRSTAVIGATIVTGGVGAVPAGMAYDVAVSSLTGKPQGYVAATKNLIKKPSFSTVLDVGLITAGDVASGLTGAKGVQNTVIPKPKGKDAVIDALLVTDAVCKGGQKYLLNEAIQSVTTRPASKKAEDKCNYGGYSSDDEPRLTGVPSYVISQESSDEDTDEEDEFDDAFDYDDYEVDATTPLTLQQKREGLQDKKKQTPQGNLPRESRKRNISISTREELNKSRQKFKNRDPNDRNNAVDENLWRNPVWLHLRMPHTFNYTGAVVTNLLQKGLLHIVIRHGHQLENHIPDFGRVFRELPAEIQSRIRRIQNTTNDSTVRNLTAQLGRALKKLDSEETDGILFDLQMMLYDYLQNNVVFDIDNHGYLGDGCNNLVHQTVFFKVFDRDGNTQVMVLCVSDDLYHNPLCFEGDGRPVRAVITCYYIPWEKYISRQVDTLFDILEHLRD